MEGSSEPHSDADRAGAELGIMSGGAVHGRGTATMRRTNGYSGILTRQNVQALAAKRYSTTSSDICHESLMRVSRHVPAGIPTFAHGTAPRTCAGVPAADTFGTREPTARSEVDGDPSLELHTAEECNDLLEWALDMTVALSVSESA